jgi:hypothetical protein
MEPGLAFGRARMTEDERKAGNRRETIHFWSRRALYSLSRVYDLDVKAEKVVHPGRRGEAVVITHTNRTPGSPE